MSEALGSILDKALQFVPDAKQGLPEEIFYFVSRLTPMVNVDLLIKDQKGRTLLTWREDRFYGPGWHIPGGIIRFKESIEDRIKKVAHFEVGCDVIFDSSPINVRSQVCDDRDIRGHFISLLYSCSLKGEPDPVKRFDDGNPLNGQWSWHESAPADLLKVHESFRKFIDAS